MYQLVVCILFSNLLLVIPYSQLTTERLYEDQAMDA